MAATLERLRPRTLQDVQDAVVEANGQRTTIEVRGGGSKAAIGAPEPADLLLDTARLDAVIDYDPAELVLTAGAGAKIRDIEAMLAKNGQMLAFEPMDYGPLLVGSPGKATLGGVLTANVSGPRRLAAGAARDHFLGLEAVSGRGDVFKAGGRVVKNVTGYDLPKLIGGSWGTLAVLVTVTIKVLPRPRASATVVMSGLTDEAAASLMSACVGSAAPVTGAAHLPGGSMTILRLEGIKPAIASGVDIVRGLAGGGAMLDGKESETLWREVRDVAAFAGGAGDVWRISAPPAQGWRIIAALEPLEPRVVYDWAGGLIWLDLPAADDACAPAVRAAVTLVGGHATLIRSSAAARAAVPVFQPEQAGLAALSARVRAAFDPAGVLGPRHRLAGA